MYSNITFTIQQPHESNKKFFLKQLFLIKVTSNIRDIKIDSHQSAMEGSNQIAPLEAHATTIMTTAGINNFFFFKRCFLCTKS